MIVPSFPIKFCFTNSLQNVSNSFFDTFPSINLSLNNHIVFASGILSFIPNPKNLINDNRSLIWYSVCSSLISLKIQQPNKISIFEDAELVRDSVHTMIDVCGTLYNLCKMMILNIIYYRVFTISIVFLG